jgi:GH24 family phage-related lysozyme (muramidase)
VDQLLQAVEQLPPAQRREFQRRLAHRPGRDGAQQPEEATLVRVARAGLPAAAERRLRRLLAKSERGDLTPKERTDYQALAQEAQRIDAARVEALAELARRRGQSVQEVRVDIDDQGDTDAT